MLLESVPKNALALLRASAPQVLARAAKLPGSIVLGMIVALLSVVALAGRGVADEDERRRCRWRVAEYAGQAGRRFGLECAIHASSALQQEARRVIQAYWHFRRWYGMSWFAMRLSACAANRCTHGIHQRAGV